MRSVFLGTPDFAVPSLRALASRHEVAAVFTQPDRPKGRGNRLSESPVKAAARQLGLAVQQPERIRREPHPALLAELRADIIVVVGYGQIIPQSIIDLPRYGILNVHASLLPKYRGAAPIQWALANGERETGVTIMQIDAGLDTGAMLRRVPLSIRPDETAPELSERLAPLGAAALLEVLDEIENGAARPEKQDDVQATLAPILKKQDGLVDWRRTASEIYDRLRGFTPWPGAFTSLSGVQLALAAARPADRSGLAPGQLLREPRRLFAGCGGGTALELLALQPAGKARMSAEAFLNGYHLKSDQILGES